MEQVKSLLDSVAVFLVGLFEKSTKETKELLILICKVSLVLGALYTIYSVYSLLTLFAFGFLFLSVITFAISMILQIASLYIAYKAMKLLEAEIAK